MLFVSLPFVFLHIRRQFQWLIYLHQHCRERFPKSLHPTLVSDGFANRDFTIPREGMRYFFYNSATESGERSDEFNKKKLENGLSLRSILFRDLNDLEASSLSMVSEYFFI